MKACPAGTDHEAWKARAWISTAGLAALLGAKVPLTLLDARWGGKADDGKRIPGAIAVNPEWTDAELTAAVPNKSGLIVTYCANMKCPASVKLAKRLRTLGYANVLELPKGIEGWIAAGHEVTETAK